MSGADNAAQTVLAALPGFGAALLQTAVVPALGLIVLVGFVMWAAKVSAG